MSSRGTQPPVTGFGIVDAEFEGLLDGSEKVLPVLALDEGEVVRDVVRGPR